LNPAQNGSPHKAQPAPSPNAQEVPSFSTA
jgi:hypothetical protein